MYPRTSAVLCAAGIVLGLSCFKEVPPSVPLVRIAETAQPGDTLRARARSTDQNGGHIAFLFDWGDGSDESWSAEVQSGDTLSRGHVFKDVGSYLVRVKARDQEGNESEWSDGDEVAIAFAGPFVSGLPQAPDTAFPDTALWFAASAGHVRGESVSVQFDWGDGLQGEWSRFVGPDEPVQDSHRFEATGCYQVKARAKDRDSNTSPWSAPAVLEVSEWPLGPPVLLPLSTDFGVDVMLRWDPGRNQDSVLYSVWFRALGNEEFTLATIGYRSRAIHDPAGRTGWYTVSARLGDDELFAAETLSTVPVFTDSLMVLELNAGREAGYGWDLETGSGGLFPMDDTGSAAQVDFYFTDRSPGHNGPSFWLSSPRLGPEDPGGLVPRGDWRTTWLYTLWGSGQEPVPEFDSLLYREEALVNPGQIYYAVHTSDQYYALVLTENPDPDQGLVVVYSWFQPVRGLRLLRHPELEPRP